MNELGFRSMIEKIMENIITKRPDTNIWFVNLGKFLYAKTAEYADTFEDGEEFFLEKIAVRRYSRQKLIDTFGIDPKNIRDNEAHIVLMENYPITDSNYKDLNETLGIAKRQGDCYYVASNLHNKYAFPLFNTLNQLGENATIRKVIASDIHVLFLFYNLFKHRQIPNPECQ